MTGKELWTGKILPGLCVVTSTMDSTSLFSKIWVVLTHSRLRIPNEAANLVFQVFKLAPLKFKGNQWKLNGLLLQNQPVQPGFQVLLDDLHREFYVDDIKYPLYLRDERRNYTYCVLCCKCFMSIILFNPHKIPMQHALVPHFYRQDKREVKSLAY